jgi:hypothetical protein
VEAKRQPNHSTLTDSFDTIYEVLNNHIAQGL